MKDNKFKTLLDSVLINDKNIKIDNQIFPIKGMIGQGYHKQVFEIDDGKNNKVIKIIRKDAVNIESAFLSFQQSIENQNILDNFKVVYAKIIDFDKNGPPYRFLIQEKILNNGISADELIKNKSLSENDIYQIAEVINKFEESKKWQIDTSPFNWFKVKNKLIYTGGTVYNYNSKWKFSEIGLWQWIDTTFTSNTSDQSTKIPSQKDKERLIKLWQSSTDQEIGWWKKYLNTNVQPKLDN